MTDDDDQRIRTLISRVLRVSADSLRNDVRRGTLQEWDSLGHVMLVSALSDEFEVRISPELALQMHTIGDIKQIIHELKA